MFRIVYEKNQELNGYFVRFPLLCQQIFVAAGYFVKVMNTDSRVVLGYWEADAKTLMKLGFVLPAELQKNVG